MAVGRHRDDDYAAAHPRPEDLLLVIEVAETSAGRDRLHKIRRYGRAAVTEAWLLDVEAGSLEVYRLPGPDGYGERSVLGPGDRVAPAAFPDIFVEVDEILV